VRAPAGSKGRCTPQPGRPLGDELGRDTERHRRAYHKGRATTQRDSPGGDLGFKPIPDSGRARRACRGFSADANAMKLGYWRALLGDEGTRLPTRTEER